MHREACDGAIHVVVLDEGRRFEAERRSWGDRRGGNHSEIECARRFRYKVEASCRCVALRILRLKGCVWFAATLKGNRH